MIVSHFGNYIHVNSFEVRGVVGGVLIGRLDKCKKVINNTHTCFFPCVGLKSGCFCFVFSIVTVKFPHVHLIIIKVLAISKRSKRVHFTDIPHSTDT